MPPVQLVSSTSLSRTLSWKLGLKSVRKEVNGVGSAGGPCRRVRYTLRSVSVGQERLMEHKARKGGRNRVV